MYAYVKDGRLDSFSEEFFPKHIPEKEEITTEKTEDGKTAEKTVKIPEVPGLVYDECIEYDFEDVPVLEDGKIIPYSESNQKIDDDKRKADEEAARKQIRKSEIRAQIGILAKQRDGLIELDETAQADEIQSEIDALKAEYATL